MRILNLYAGIGGNRKLWDEVEDIEVTAVEYDAEIAKAYKERYPEDTVITGDAKQYLLENYNDFDFIWASPPCQSHSNIRKCKVDCPENIRGSVNAIYPDMSLYEIIIFLKHHCKNNTHWIVENVRPYYEPLIKQDTIIDRHYYWSNFNISQISIKKKYNIEDVVVGDFNEIDLKKYKIKRRVQVIRNQVDYEVGKHILECALDKVSYKQGSLFE